MTEQNRKNLVRGVRNGIPISMGYFAVGFTIMMVLDVALG